MPTFPCQFGRSTTLSFLNGKKPPAHLDTKVGNYYPFVVKSRQNSVCYRLNQRFSCQCVKKAKKSLPQLNSRVVCGVTVRPSCRRRPTAAGIRHGCLAVTVSNIFAWLNLRSLEQTERLKLSDLIGGMLGWKKLTENEDLLEDRNWLGFAMGSVKHYEGRISEWLLF